MKIFVFGKENIGDKIIRSVIEKNSKYTLEYLGEKVDFSKIIPAEQNLIIISNPLLFNFDMFRLLGCVNKELDKPLVVSKKIKAFAAFIYEPDLKVSKILVNKVYVFGGIVYLLKNDLKSTMAETFRQLDVKRLRSYII